MKIRLITGSAYIAVLAGFFCLKIFVHDLFFDALIYFFALGYLPCNCMFSSATSYD